MLTRRFMPPEKVSTLSRWPGRPGRSRSSAVLHCAGAGRLTAHDRSSRPKKSRFWRALSVRVERDLLGHDAQELLSTQGIGLDRMTADVGLTGAGFQQPADHRDHGGLARAVWPQQAENLPPVNIEIHIFDRVNRRAIPAFEGFAQPAHLYQFVQPAPQNTQPNYLLIRV
jgi:hypothetical protein